MVTGATDGLGRGVAAELAKRGATVLLHGRSQERLDATVGELTAETGSASFRTYRADFTSLEEVRGMAADVRADEARLDALVNNAGVGFLPDRNVTRDGIELVFQVNYLAGYLLTRDLLDLLRASAPARVVFVASAGQAAIDFADPMLEGDYGAERAYHRSKLAQVVLTMDLAGRVGDGVTVTALHPSTYMPTKLLGPDRQPVSTTAQGIAATVRLVADPGLHGVTGAYFDVDAEARAHPQAYDPDAQDRLRALSEKLVG